MAGYTLYPEELDIFQTNFKIANKKSLFSTVNFPRLQSEYEFIPHTNRVNNLFRPLRIILTILGRWPFQLQLHSRTSWAEDKAGLNDGRGFQKHTTDTKIPYYKYTSSLKSVFWIYFILTTLFLSMVLVFSVLGFCDFFLDWHLFSESSWDEEEQRNFESNLVPFVLVWSCLMHSSISSISIFINRRNVSKFLNYWNYAVDAMAIELPKGIKNYVIMNNIFFLAFLVVIFIAYRILCLNLIRGGAVLVGILTFRPFIFLFDITEGLFRIRIFGMVAILYSVYASRAFLLFFSFKSKLLRHCFKIWNLRFKNLLNDTLSQKSHKEDQIQCEKLFADYTILLKLVRLSDNVFGVVLQSYYGSQLLNMCFELYYLARSGTYNKSSLDIFGACVVLVQNLYIFFTVSLCAADVNEEATRGQEILRRNGISPMDSVHKKYLISNMQMIFSQRIVLTGGKYFSVDRPFIITVLGAVFTYFIIVLQVGPSLHKKIEEVGG